MVYASSKVESSLSKKGFIKNNSHHLFYVFMYNNKKSSIKTKVSHDRQEINNHLISQMSKQLHLCKKDFCDLIDCPLSKEEYIKKLIDQGILKESK